MVEEEVQIESFPNSLNKQKLNETFGSGKDLRGDLIATEPSPPISKEKLSGMSGIYTNKQAIGKGGSLNNSMEADEE